MARKRMIDPTIWEDENFGKLSRDARLLFIGLFSNADDEGRLRANASYIRSTIFMYDDFSISDIEKLILEVTQIMKTVSYYEVDGNKYIQLTTWDNYQKQHKDRIQKSILPSNNDYVGQVTDNVGQMPAQDKLSKVKLSKDKIDNSEEKKYEKKSEDFSQLKTSLGIPQTPINGITHEFQDEALRIIQALNIPNNRKSAYFKAVKEENRGNILDAYAYAIDYPDPLLRDKMFFWKLNELKK